MRQFRLVYAWLKMEDQGTLKVEMEMTDVEYQCFRQFAKRLNAEATKQGQFTEMKVRREKKTCAISRRKNLVR